MSRIAIISSFMGPYYSNYVASMAALEGELHRRGDYSIYIFPKEIEHYGWVEKFREINQNIYFLPYAPRSLGNFFGLRRILKSEKIDVCYTRMGGWDVTTRLALPFMPVIWHIDMDIHITPRSRKIKNWIKYKLLALWNTRVITLSSHANDNINSFGLHHPATVVPNAIDLSRLELRNGTRENPDGVPRLLIFAYEPVNKGLVLTLEALERINAASVKYRLLVSAQKKTYAYMKERYGEKPPSWVALLPPTDNIASVYAQADAMLIPSYSEGFSYCLAEAIYTGLPVVCSDIPGNQWAKEFAGSFFFTPGDSNGLEKSIDICMNRKILSEEQTANRSLMNAKYSMVVWTKKIADLIHSVL